MNFPLSNLLGFLMPAILYALCGIVLHALFKVKSRGIFPLLVAGYAVSQTFFCLIAFLTNRGWVAFYALLLFYAAILILVIGNRDRRPFLRDSFKQIGWKEPCLFALIIGSVGFSFLTTPAKSPWGVLNADLFDALRGGFVLFHSPEEVYSYKKATYLFMVFGQYSASALSFVISCKPEALLADYWHLLFLLGLLAVGIYRLARDVWNLSSTYALLASLMVGLGSFIVTTIYNGHVGSSMFMPLMIYIYHWYHQDSNALYSWVVVPACIILIFMSYGFPVVLYGSALLLAYLMSERARRQFRWLPSGMVVAMGAFSIGIICLVVTYPWFAKLRQLTEIKMRAWEMSLRADIVPIYWGFDALGLAYMDGKFSNLISPSIAFAVCILLFSIVVFGVLRQRVTKSGSLGFAFLIVLIVFGSGIRIVIQDSYYFYKCLYISYPMVAIFFASGLEAISKKTVPFKVLREIPLCMGISLLAVNIYNNWIKIEDFCGNPANVRMADVSNGIGVIFKKFLPVASGGTREEWNNILDAFRMRRLGELTRRDRWKFEERQKKLRQEAAGGWVDRETIESEYERDIRRLTFEDSNHFVFPKHYPEILRFEGWDPPVLWENPIWCVVDMSCHPTIKPSNLFDVMRYPFALNNAPFRWMSNSLKFHITRWPKTHSHLRFYAEAGYGSTSGTFDLSVTLNDHEIDRRILTRSGESVECEFDPMLIRDENVLEFKGDSLPGPPIRKRELKFLKARVARIRIAPQGSADPELNVLFNGPDDIGTWHEGISEQSSNLVALGTGWGGYESYEGKHFRWIEDRPVKLMLLNREEVYNKLVIAGKRGPLLSPNAQLWITANGKHWAIPLNDTQIELKLDKPGGRLESLELKIEPSAGEYPHDPRKLSYQVFSIRLEKTGA